MAYTNTTKKKRHGKDIFLTGEYIQHFKPDDRLNPFYKIYNRKKQDIVNIINVSADKKSILDVGGGMGRLSLELSKSGHNKIVLADVSIDMLKLAGKGFKNLNTVNILNTDAHHLPFRANSFDLVVGLDLFCHLENPVMALHEFHRVLKNRGLLILDSTNSNPLWALFYPRYLGKNPLNWLKILKFKGNLPGWETIVNHYPKKKFFSFLHNTGFKIIQLINYGPIICPKWHLAISEKMV
jgi:ubiquinone/menaquinone biosynthesis C-methylase UbiE